MRKCGILLPISALPSKYGIGTFGQEAYDFINFLQLAKQSYWQVLPLEPTSYGDSPYQSFCAYAGNPYFIDLDLLKEDGLLNDEDLSCLNDAPFIIDYANLYKKRYNILRKAYYNFLHNKNYPKNKISFDNYIYENKTWLNDYALFMSIKSYHNDVSWQYWKPQYRYYNQKILEKYYINHQDDVHFWMFVQYEFDKQWQALKNYAHQCGIEIIGDVPIYVALDSCDVWANTKLFQLDKELKLIKVAGCPPDAFCEEGQLWGNPLYNYKIMKTDHYKWWTNRIKKATQLYDVIRIDHFRGFESYYAIPSGDKTAKNGKWEKGPGYSLFKAIKEEIPNIRIIAEDLGFLTKNVFQLLRKTGFPGMKVLEFAFDDDKDNMYLPHNYIKNCVVYTGTHDNMPLRAWFHSLTQEKKHLVREYIMLENDDKICDQMIRVALGSVSDLVIIPIQDYLGFGIESRINTPSTINGNWTYRIEKKYLSSELALYIAFLTTLYKRY